MQAPGKDWLASRPYDPSLEAFEQVAEASFVDCEGGALRLLRVRPDSGSGVRPIVMMPGFGTGVGTWGGFFGACAGEAEVVALETLDKSSTRLDGRALDLHPSGLARQVRAGLDALGFEDFVLIGASWHAGVVLQGLHDGVLPPATFLAYDPVPRSPFPGWALSVVNALVPDALISALRMPILRWRVPSMPQEHQRKRIETIIREGDVFRWRTAATHGRDFDLMEVLPVIADEVFVVNGSDDPVHGSHTARPVASALPRGRLIQLAVEEQLRERFAGAVALAFAEVRRAEGLPAPLADLEQELDRPAH